MRCSETDKLSLVYCLIVIPVPRQGRIPTCSQASAVSVLAHGSVLRWVCGPDILAERVSRGVLLHSRACLKIPFHGSFEPRRSDAVGFGRCSSHTSATLWLSILSLYFLICIIGVLFRFPTLPISFGSRGCCVAWLIGQQQGWYNCYSSSDFSVTRQTYRKLISELQT